MRDRSDPVVFAKLWARLAAQPEVKILLLGLDSAGKSTILYKITTGEVVATAPTVGSNVEVRAWDTKDHVVAWLQPTDLLTMPSS
jgi:GTPase SAR1 family protein